MRKRIGALTMMLALAAMVADAQDFREKYEQFKQKATQTYNDFRAEANAKYCEFLKGAWEWYEQMPVVKKPKDETVPPVVLPENDKQKPVTVRPILLDTVVAPTPITVVQPTPVSPIKDVPTVAPFVLHFTFYGTRGDVRLPQQPDAQLTALNGNFTNKDMSAAWRALSSQAYDNAVRDCIAIRTQHQLDDYAYLLMLRSLGESYFGGECNAATALTAWLFCQSGYQMRLGNADGRLLLLFGTKHVIYDLPYFVMDGEGFYLLKRKGENFNSRITACDVAFPGEQPLSLEISQPIRFANDESGVRTLKSSRYRELAVNVSVNKNLINYYNDYLSSYKDDNLLTRWALLANAPLQESTAEAISEQMRPCLAGKSQLDQVEMILNWVQTGFVYEYDDKVWGEDRAFFAEETLYYPYCDCEDRAILFTRLVRNLVGLKCALVYYPGHLAAAVHFTDAVNGDYLQVNGERFTIADPTYINAPVGRTMPKMMNRSATAILLQ